MAVSKGFQHRSCSPLTRKSDLNVLTGGHTRMFNNVVGLVIVNRGNGYETRQSSLLYVFVLFFGLDPAQNTIVVYSVLRN